MTRRKSLVVSRKSLLRFRNDTTAAAKRLLNLTARPPENPARYNLFTPATYDSRFTNHVTSSTDADADADAGIGGGTTDAILAKAA